MDVPACPDCLSSFYVDSMAWSLLCRLADVAGDKPKYVEREEHQLAVFLDRGRVYVMDNYCPHAGGSLAGGFVENGCAVCPWHYWHFRLETGVLTTSAAVRVKTYPARIVAGEGGEWVEAELGGEMIP